MACYTIHLKGGGKAFLCGDLGPHCADSNCGDVGAFLCDYPVGENRTCDLHICNGHAFEVAPNMHYCPGHTTMWNQFQLSEGVQKHLENVVPYRHAVTICPHPGCATPTTPEPCGYAGCPRR